MSYRRATQAFSLAMVAIGLVILVSTIVNGGGPTSLGVVMGIGFVGVGIGRLWIAGKMSE